jgi:hypothetical protein
VPSLCYSIKPLTNSYGKNNPFIRFLAEFQYFYRKGIVDYSKYTIEFTSSIACQSAFTHLRKKWKREKWKTFMKCRDSGGGGGLAGQVFEHAVHEIFRSVGTEEGFDGPFPIRELLPKSNFFVFIRRNISFGQHNRLLK